MLPLASMGTEIFSLMFNSCPVIVLVLVLYLQVLPSLCCTSFVFGDSLVDAGNNDYLFSLSKIERIPLRELVDYLEQSRSYMLNVIGENAVMDLLKEAMFSVTTGSNDILDHLQPSIPLFGKRTTSATMLQDFMVLNLTTQLTVLNIYSDSVTLIGVEFSDLNFPVKRLHKLVARKLMVVGDGPLGCIPFVRVTNFLPSGACAIEVNELVQSYKKKLNRLLDHLNQEMEAEATFVYANSYDIVMRIIQNYQEYG